MSPHVTASRQTIDLGRASEHSKTWRPWVKPETPRLLAWPPLKEQVSLKMIWGVRKPTSLEEAPRSPLGAPRPSWRGCFVMEEPERIDVVLSRPACTISRTWLPQACPSRTWLILSGDRLYSPDIEPDRNHAAPDRRRASPSLHRASGATMENGGLSASETAFQSNIVHTPGWGGCRGSPQTGVGRPPRPSMVNLKGQRDMLLDGLRCVFPIVGASEPCWRSTSFEIPAVLLRPTWSSESEQSVKAKLQKSSGSSSSRVSEMSP